MQNKVLKKISKSKKSVMIRSTNSVFFSYKTVRHTYLIIPHLQLRNDPNQLNVLSKTLKSDLEK